MEEPGNNYVYTSNQFWRFPASLLWWAKFVDCEQELQLRQVIPFFTGCVGFVLFYESLQIATKRFESLIKLLLRYSSHFFEIYQDLKINRIETSNIESGKKLVVTTWKSIYSGTSLTSSWILASECCSIFHRRLVNASWSSLDLTLLEHCVSVDLPAGSKESGVVTSSLFFMRWFWTRLTIRRFTRACRTKMFEVEVLYYFY